MKTRIAVLFSCILIIAACTKDHLPPPEELTPRPQIVVYSPLIGIFYKAGDALPIRGEITDTENIKTLSFIVYRNATGTDTLYNKTSIIENTSFTFNETWTPETLDFTGSENIYLLEVKVTHATTSAIPSTSYFQEVKVYR